MRSAVSCILVLLMAGVACGDWLEQAARSQLKAFEGGAGAQRRDDNRHERGHVTVRRINPQGRSDWDNDPTALPYLFYQLEQRTEGTFPAYVDNRGISLLGDEIFDYPIIYFTSHWEFTFTGEEVDNLQKYLARGGTLWLDDCAGSGPYMDSVPANIQRIIPGVELEQVLIESDEYADFFNMLYQLDQMPRLKEQFMQPFQVARLNGRPAIIICPNDYGCYWEVSTPPTALNPLGGQAHGATTPTGQIGREQVYQLSINWLFYTLTH